MDADITILGLGPGDPDLLTRQAWSLLQSCSQVYLRTRQHPVVEALPTTVQVHSFDYLYESQESFEAVYAQIVDEVLALGRRAGGVIYGVPGHPYVAEATAPEIVRRAKAEGLKVRVIEGLSFLEPTFSALGVDPLPHTALVDALEVAAGHACPFPPHIPALIAQIHSRAVASDVKLTLMSHYPDEHPVQLLHAAGTKDELVENLALYEIDRSQKIGLLTALYVPPLGPATSFEEFQEVIAHLRAPEGCPWDREQTHLTLRSGLLEEAYETLAALDAEDPQALREELGDLLLEIVMQTQIATEEGEFNMPDVLRGVNNKIVRRHPHVFGDQQAEDAQAVLLNWERLKEQERSAEGKAEASLLDGIPLALPALVRAQQTMGRAARVGFEWPDIQAVVAKLEEEMAEAVAAEGEAARVEEIGDLLFTAVNLSRWYEVDAESALRAACERFYKRFSHIESTARAQGRSVSDLSLDEMLSLWRAAKHHS
jgi:tetrapyrrole methylase family protein/MazG family protein